MNLQMFKDENAEQFIWRLGQYKDSGMTDMSWDEIADVINRELGNDDCPMSSSAYRKSYQQAKRFLNAGVFKDIVDNNYLEELKAQENELAKQKVKLRDERNELNRVIREEARRESFKEQILRSISEHECSPLMYDGSRVLGARKQSDNDLIISMTDLHTGIQIDNYFNKFDQDILRERLNKYLDKVFDVQSRHNSENAHVILSELVSGIIHNELRIESNQTLIEQFLTATDYISQFLIEISYRFNEVSVYMCAGNHSRISPKKEDSLKGENIDHLAIPFLKAKLQNFKNIKFGDNDMEESIAIFDVRGNTVMASHGDKDSPSNVVQKFTMMFGTKPALVYLGHRHTNGMSTVYDTKVIQSGCMSGSDSYCMDKRLRNKPEQTISVVNEGGLECIYDVRLD